MFFQITYQILIFLFKYLQLISFKPTPQALAHWRRKIKNWLKNADKPETSNKVILDKILICFYRRWCFNRAYSYSYLSRKSNKSTENYEDKSFPGAAKEASRNS